MPGDASRENGKKGGRPPGALNQSTLTRAEIKAEARKLLAQQFVDDLPEFYQAQRAQALGTKFLVTRDPKSGKFIPLDEEKAKLMIECGQADALEIWDRPPQVQAFVALWDRALDKPTEHMELTGEGGGPLEVINLLRSRRAGRQAE